MINLHTLPFSRNAKQLIRNLTDDDWFKKHQKGSHLQMAHATKTGKVTVPIHSGEIKPGTLHSILKQAGLK